MRAADSGSGTSGTPEAGASDPRWAGPARRALPPPTRSKRPRDLLQQRVPGQTKVPRQPPLLAGLSRPRGYFGAWYRVSGKSEFSSVGTQEWGRGQA